MKGGRRLLERLDKGEAVVLGDVEAPLVHAVGRVSQACDPIAP